MGRPKKREDHTRTGWYEPFALPQATRDELAEIAAVERLPDQSAAMLSEVEGAVGEYWVNERIVDQRPRPSSAAEELSQLEVPVARLVSALAPLTKDSFEDALDLACDLSSQLDTLTVHVSAALCRSTYSATREALEQFVHRGGGTLRSRIDLTVALRRLGASIAEAICRFRAEESRGRSRRDAYVFLLAALSRVYRRYAPSSADSTASLDVGRNRIRDDGTKRDPPLHGSRLEMDFVAAILRGARIPHPQDPQEIARKMPR